MHKNKGLYLYGAALLATFFWSFSFIWFKVAFIAYKPITVIFFRLAIASVFIIVLASIFKKLQRLNIADLKVFILLSFFEPFVYFMGESFGLQYVSSTTAAVIVATIPLFTPLAAWYFHNEKLSPMNLVGLFFTFLGVSVVVFNKSFEFLASPLGIGLEFIAVFSTIGYTVVLKNLTKIYNTYTIVAYQNLIGLVMFLPFFLVFDWADFINTPFNYKAFEAIVLLAVFASTVAFIFFTYSIRQIGIIKSNIFINLIPVFVAIMAYFILGDRLSLQQIIGIGIVIGGLFLAQIKRRTGYIA